MLTMSHEILVKFCDILGILKDNNDEIQIQLLTTAYNVKVTYYTEMCVISDASL